MLRGVLFAVYLFAMCVCVFSLKLAGHFLTLLSTDDTFGKPKRCIETQIPKRSIESGIDAAEWKLPVTDASGSASHTGSGLWKVSEN